MPGPGKAEKRRPDADPAPAAVSARLQPSHPLLRVQNTLGNSAALSLLAQQTANAPSSAPAITAKEIFGLQKGDRLVISRLLPDFFFGLLRKEAPDVAGSLDALQGRISTVTEASDSRFAAGLDGAVTVPGGPGLPSRTLNGVTVALERNAAGDFDFKVTGTENGIEQDLFVRPGLKAAMSGGSVVLSAGGVPALGITPASGTQGEVKLEAFTAPYMSQMPDVARALAPASIALIGLTKLPDAPEGSAAQKEAVRRILDRSAQGRAGESGRPSAFDLGAGLSYGPKTEIAFSAAYRYNIHPWKEAGALLQIPVQVQILFTPSESIVAGVSGGIGSSMRDIGIPVNVRLLGGLGGGTLLGREAAFGPSLGVAAGLQFGAFHTEIRYERLFNLLRGQGGSRSGVGGVGLMLGAAF